MEGNNSINKGRHKERNREIKEDRVPQRKLR
jgi:hypothetical protein